jgi:hypothetical protein
VLHQPIPLHDLVRTLGAIHGWRLALSIEIAGARPCPGCYTYQAGHLGGDGVRTY